MDRQEWTAVLQQDLRIAEMKAFLLMLIARGYVPEQIEFTWLNNPASGCDEPAAVVTFKRFFNSPTHQTVFQPVAREDYNEAWELFQAYWRGMNAMKVF